MPTPCSSALVGAGLQEMAAFNLHRFIKEDFEGGGKTLESILGKQFQNGVNGRRIGIVVGQFRSPCGL